MSQTSSSLEFLMKQAGFQVRTAADGEAALAAIAAEQPDLVLLDVMMPRKMAMKSARPFAPILTGKASASSC